MEKQSQKDRFDKLLQKEGITQMKLFIDILKMNGERDPYQKAQTNKANFNKMIIGEREFLGSYIAPLEEILHTTYRYIKYGGEENNDFEPRGIRYAAYLNDYSYYERLDDTKDKLSPLICADEFFKNALDYILQYQSKNGLRYIIEKGYTKLRPYGDDMMEGPIFAVSGGHGVQKVTKLLCEIDDFDLFEKFANTWNAVKDVPGLKPSLMGLNDDLILQGISNTKHIWKGLLASKVIPLKEVNRKYPDETKNGLFANPLVNTLCDYLLRKGKTNEGKTNEILRYGIEHNKKAIEWFKKHFDPIKDYSLLDNGHVLSSNILYGSLVLYALESQPDVGEETYRLMQELNYEINRFQFASRPLFGGFSNKNARLIDGKIAKKSSNNETEYEALKFFQDNKIDFVPRLIGQKAGFDYLTYIPGKAQSYVTKMPLEQTKNLLRLLRKLNDLSKAKLNGKVYVHDDLSQGNVVFNEKGEIQGIIDWDSCHIGEEYEDIVYIMWTWANIGDPSKDDEETLVYVKECLKAYKADNELKSHFAEKMKKVMEKRLLNTPKSSANYAQIFKWVKESEIWVDLYQERMEKEIG